MPHVSALDLHDSATENDESKRASAVDDDLSTCNDDGAARGLTPALGWGVLNYDELWCFAVLYIYIHIYIYIYIGL